MADIIQKIVTFFTGDEFRNIMTSFGAILLAISPFLFKLITNRFDKWKIRFQGKSEELKEALELVAKLEQKAKQEATQMNVLINQVNEMMKAQSKAMQLAFSRSNLKEDVKGSIANILNSSTKPIPLETHKGQAENNVITPVEKVKIDNPPQIENQTTTEKQLVRGY